jgi:hypothetical protein
MKWMGLRKILKYKNPPRGIRVAVCGRTEGQRQTWRRLQPFFAILRTRLKTVWSSYVEISDIAPEISLCFVLCVDYLPSSVCYFDYICGRLSADFSGRAVWGVGLRPLACWDCGFESRREHGCLSGRVLCVGLITKLRKGRPWLGIASKGHNKKKTGRLSNVIC